jgi:hypothetical protein
MYQRVAQSLAVLMLACIVSGSALAQFDHTHAGWTQLLKKHVVLIDAGKASQVRYGGFQQDRAALKSYIDSLAKVGQDEYNGWNKPQQLAFLINAYNANTVELILTRYPNIKSIWDFGKVFNNPFKQKFIRLLGREMHLDDIEHGMIRADGVFNDPRIHFAVNCASVGCPMLREEAYVGERIERQLEEQTIRFISDRSRNRFNADTRTLEVTKLFDSSPWYGGDFRRGWKGFNSLEAFLGKYAAQLADRPEDQQLVRDGKASIRHLEYDWALNVAR